MDELEFRRRLLADPQDKDPAVLEEKAASSANTKLASELEQLDAMIDQALRVDVPDDLVDKILFKQSSDVVRENRKPKFHLAIAASIAFVFGILLGQFNWQSLPTSPNAASLGQIALAHYYNESPFTDAASEGATLRQVNAKLAPLGVLFNGQMPGEIAYVNHCSFDNKAALHMVLKEENGETYTVFVVPDSANKTEVYSDGKMEAVSLPAAHNSSVIVVAEDGTKLMPLAEELKAQLNQRT